LTDKCLSLTRKVGGWFVITGDVLAATWLHWESGCYQWCHWRLLCRQAHSHEVWPTPVLFYTVEHKKRASIFDCKFVKS